MANVFQISHTASAYKFEIGANDSFCLGFIEDKLALPANERKMLAFDICLLVNISVGLIKDRFFYSR